MKNLKNTNKFLYKNNLNLGKNSIKEFFDMFDSNHDGLISSKELKEVLEAFDGFVTNDEDISKFVSLYFLIIIDSF